MPPADFGGRVSVPAAGAALRDAALSAVAENAAPWFERARAFAASRGCWRGGGPFTGEDLRSWITSNVGAPHHSNAWGALVSRLVRDGIIAQTGRTVPSRRRTSHAHRTPEYRAGDA